MVEGQEIIPFGSSVVCVFLSAWGERDQEHDHQNVFVKMTSGRKVVEFA